MLAKDADDEMLLLDLAPVPGRPPNRSHTQSPHASSPEKQRRPAGKSGSETDEEDDRLLPGQVTTRGPDSVNSSTHPTPNRSASPDPEIDEREEGRVIGFSYPLDDWRKNITEGDVVSKAVEDMGYVIREIVSGQFAERRHGEMIKCMREMRETCLREDEIDEWNGCVGSGKMVQLWTPLIIGVTHTQVYDGLEGTVPRNGWGRQYRILEGSVRGRSYSESNKQDRSCQRGGQEQDIRVCGVRGGL